MGHFWWAIKISTDFSLPYTESSLESKISAVVNENISDLTSVCRSKGSGGTVYRGRNKTRNQRPASGTKIRNQILSAELWVLNMHGSHRLVRVVW